jgi:succinate-acetate transporter protein
MLIPALVGTAKLAAAGVMALTAVRFGVTGWYELTGSGTARTTAGVIGIALAAAAFYAALALELEGAKRHTILPTGRTGLAAEAERGEKVFDSAELSREPGVRPRL